MEMLIIALTAVLLVMGLCTLCITTAIITLLWQKQKTHPPEEMTEEQKKIAQEWDAMMAYRG